MRHSALVKVFDIAFLSCWVALAACGARADLRRLAPAFDAGDGSAPTEMDGFVPLDASIRDAGDSRADVSMLDGGVIRDASDARVESGTVDASPPLPEPDCSCPAEDFFIDARIGDGSVLFAYPYPIHLYCDETTVHLGNGGCDEVQRLSGCAGPDAAPPCLYAAIDPNEDRVYVGHLVLSPGIFLELSAGALEVHDVGDRVAEGRLEASFSGADGGIVVVAADFRACRPLLPPADCGG